MLLNTVQLNCHQTTIAILDDSFLSSHDLCQLTGVLVNLFLHTVFRTP